MRPSVEITDTPDHGTILKCADAKVADEFEDFLTERCYVLFNVKFEPTDVTFFFGQASSTSKVRDLYERFVNESTS